MQTPRPPTKIILNIIWIGDITKNAPSANTAPAVSAASSSVPAVAGAAAPAASTVSTAGAAAPAAASASAAASVPAAAAAPRSASAQAAAGLGPALAPGLAPAPAASAPPGVAGHDTQAAIEMAARINNKTHNIFFWCLDEHVDHYEKIFRTYPNIQVYGVRKFLNQDFHNPIINSAAAIALKFIADLLKPERNTIRDRVTIKEIVSLFLLLSLGDYILDSNVRPTDKLSLLRFNDFYMPQLFSAKGEPALADVWMMFSPPTNNRVALAAFNNFHQELLNAENNIFAKEGYSEPYYAIMGGALVRAVQNAKPKYWYAALSADNYSAHVKQVGVNKYYFNTHKWNARSAFESDDKLARSNFDSITASQIGFFSSAAKTIIYEYLADEKSKGILAIRNPLEIFEFNDLGLAIESGYTKRLVELVGMEVDVDQLWTTDEYKDLTPLHYAIIQRQLGCAEALLQAGARVDLKVTRLSDNATFTALELIQLITRDHVRQDFMDVYRKHYPNANAHPIPRTK